MAGTVHTNLALRTGRTQLHASTIARATELAVCTGLTFAGVVSTGTVVTELVTFAGVLITTCGLTDLVHTDTGARTVRVVGTGEVTRALAVVTSLTCGTGHVSTRRLKALVSATNALALAGVLLALVFDTVAVDTNFTSSTLLVGAGVRGTLAVHTNLLVGAEHTGAGGDALSSAAVLAIGALLVRTGVGLASSFGANFAGLTVSVLFASRLHALTTQTKEFSRTVFVELAGVGSLTLAPFADLLAVSQSAL